MEIKRGSELVVNGKCLTVVEVNGRQVRCMNLTGATVYVTMAEAQAAAARLAEVAMKAQSNLFQEGK